MSLGAAGLVGAAAGAVARLERRSRRQESAAAFDPDGEGRNALPVAIGDFTDFYASIFHATNAGRAFRPDNPLLPNYKYVPVAYHGRASSVRVSGTPVKRPQGQRKRAEEAAPSYGPSRNLDFELELGFYIGAPTAARRNRSRSARRPSIFSASVC